jgi:hypothetical protein
VGSGGDAGHGFPLRHGVQPMPRRRSHLIIIIIIIIIIDDPLEPDEALSESNRKNANEWVRNRLR